MTLRTEMTAAAVLACMLSGCGGTAEPPPPPPVQETVFGDAVGTMDRARAVDDITQQQKRDLDEAIQRSEGASGSP